MMENDPPGVDPSRQRLFVDWLGFLLDREFGAPQQGKSGDFFTVGLTDGTEIRISFPPPAGSLSIEVVPESAADISRIVAEAAAHANAGDLGPGYWYEMSLSCDVGLEGLMPIHFMRSLSEHKRFEGAWILGSDCLIEFVQSNTDPSPIIIPKFEVSAAFRVPSPWHGPYGQEVAEEFGTFVRSVIAFVSAAPFKSLAGLFPAKPDRVQDVVRTLASRPSELHVAGLEIAPALAWLAGAGRRDALKRAEGALYAYEQALAQQSEYVALILLVTSIEALTVPDTRWAKERLTKRFVEWTLEMCSGEVGAVLRHNNFESAFGSVRKPQRFLELLYNARSRPLHTGFVPSHLSALPDMGGSAGIRVMLVSEIARAAIIGFLKRPFTSLIGHPDIDAAADRD